MMPWARTYITICTLFYIPLSTIFIFRNTMQGCGYGFLPMMGGVVELVARMLVAMIAMRVTAMHFPASATRLHGSVPACLQVYLIFS